ncbi:MAG: alpha-amylase family glycosyl hydrolase [Pseudomonadota bacterium]
MSASRSAAQLGGDPDWWRGGVIYQIYPRSFLDSNADGVGDLPGVSARLDYIAALGVDAIWVSPFYPSPMKDFGYDVSDYCNVDPMFGSLQDFDRLLSEAHARGLRVLVDLVLSHTSDQHPWFAESRLSRDNARADWYVWSDPKPDGTPPNNWLSIFGGPAWEWDSRRRQYYMHNFLASQPDLNFHNPDVQDAILDVARFWLSRGVDGFRLDTANMYAHDLELRDNPASPPGEVNGIPPTNPFGYQEPLYNINRPETLAFHERLRALMDEFPATAAVGELGATKNMFDTLRAYTAPGRLHMAYSFDFLREDFGAGFVRRVAERMDETCGVCWPAWAFSNHDVPRVVSRWGLGMQADRAAPFLTAMLTSLRGTPCLYQGEELGLPEAIVPYELLQDPYGIRFWPDFPGRDGCRTPMPWAQAAPHGAFSDANPWLPVPPEHMVRAVSVQEAEEESTLSRTRNFLRWRRTRPELLKGEIEFVDTEEPVLAFRRRFDGTETLCVFNCSNRTASFEAQGLGPISPLVGHGFEGVLEGSGVRLPGFAAFFGELAA